MFCFVSVTNKQSRGCVSALYMYCLPGDQHCQIWQHQFLVRRCRKQELASDSFWSLSPSHDIYFIFFTLLSANPPPHHPASKVTYTGFKMNAVTGSQRRQCQSDSGWIERCLGGNCRDTVFHSAESSSQGSSQFFLNTLKNKNGVKISYVGMIRGGEAISDKRFLLFAWLSTRAAFLSLDIPLYCMCHLLAGSVVTENTWDSPSALGNSFRQ